MTIPVADLKKGNVVNRQRNAFRVAVILLAAIGINVILSFGLGIQSGDWQHFARGGVVIAFGLATLYSIRLMRQDRPLTGLWVIIGSFSTTILLTGLLLAELGIILGLIEVFIVSVVAVYALPSQQIGRAIALSVVAAVAAVGLDVIDPAFRLPAPASFRTALPALASAVFILNVILILRQFMSFPLRGKLIVVLTGVTAVSTTIVGSYFIYTINTDLRTQIAADQTHDAEEKNAAIESFLANLQADALFLSQSLPMTGYLETVSENGDAEAVAEAKSALENEFRVFAQNHPVYDQVRFLDVTGQEIVRLNISPDGTYNAVAQEALQNKANRYYFQNSISLSPGEVYISPLDLNVEQGQIETPHKPVIRYGVPVFNGNQIAGVLVTNVLAEIFLEPLGSGGSSAFLVDADGYYLYHPDESKRWGRDLETGFTVSQDYPELAAQLFSGEGDTFHSADQIFAYSPVTIPGEETARWYLVSFRPAAEAFAPVTGAQNAGLALLAATILLAAILAVVISQVLSKPVIALTHAAESVTEGNLNVRVSVDRQDEIGTLAYAFNTMAERIQNFVISLEGLVAARTRDLALAADVGRSVSQVHEIESLLAEAVEIIRSRFDLYYTQVYLADDAGRNLVLKQGTGEVGEQLVARGHRLPIGPGSINGMVALQKKAIYVPDTAVSPIFFPNPLLPDTRSEMAVPLLVGDHVVGVLDLQSDQPDSLTADVLPAFEALAGQLAVAVQNASLYTQAVEARSEVEARARRLTQTGWGAFLDAAERQEYIGYRYDGGRVEALSEPLAAADEDEQLWDTSIVVSGEPIGVIRLEAGPVQGISADDTQMAASVAQQVAQRIESLRLLADAERYRTEAEEATRRLTREGWDGYLKTADLPHAGYRYDQKQVAPLTSEPEEEATGNATIGLDLTVRGETIGYLEVADVAELNDEAVELVTAVAQQLSAHIETLRLTAQTEEALAETAEQARRRALLNEVSEQLNRAETLDDIYDIIASRTAQILPSDRVSLAILNATGDHFTVMALSGEGKTVPLGVPQPLAGSVTEQAITSSAVIVTHDPEPDSDQEIRSSMVAPLITNVETIGTLNVGSAAAYAYDETDQGMILQIASILASVIESKRLFAQAQEKAEELAIINEVARNVAQHMEPHQMLETVYEQIQRVMSIDSYYVGLYDPETNLVASPLVYENDRRIETPPAPLDPNSITYKVIQTGEPVLLNLTEEEKEAINQMGMTVGDASQPMTSSSVFVPLQLGQQVVGTLAVHSYEADAYDQADVALLSGIASHVAVGLENARLFEAAQARAEREALINAISQKIQTAPTVQSALQTAVSELGQALKLKRAVVELASTEPENGRTRKRAPQ